MSDKYWIPEDSPDDIARRAGYSGVGDLFSDIPEEARVRSKWDRLHIGLGKPLSEAEARGIVEDRLSRVRVFRDPPPFLGGGAWAHYVPSYIGYVLMLGEMLTSYTPYQPEASQGLLQALFEYQSLMAEIYGLEVVNSSHYDGSTSLAEALLMALRLRRGRRAVVLPDTVRPEYLETAMAYLEPHGVEVRIAPTVPGRGVLDLEALKSIVDNSVAAVVAEMPSGIGVVDPGLRGAGEIAHSAGALYIVNADPIASTLYKPPGELGADIAVGEGQPLGLGLNYGGPYLGIMAVRGDLRLIRQMPGRIAGLTRDSEGRRAFALILQTREQHIRRARATSNITTNEALMAVLAAAYIAGHGFRGLQQVALNIRAKTILARRLLEEQGYETLRGVELWREIPARPPAGCSFEEASRRAAERNVLVGPPLSSYKASWLGGWGIVAVTEAHRERHVRLMARVMGEVCRR